MWFVYIVQCFDKSLYTGITIDLKRRIIQHNNKTGAKAIKGKLPAVLVYSEQHPNRSEASKRENEIKLLTREQKVMLVKG